MKVKELIAHLQTLDQELPVYTSVEYWMSACPLSRNDIVHVNDGVRYADPPIKDAYIIDL